MLDKLPGWYQQSRINLGLDLRGGAHFLLEADLRSVLNERLTNLSDSARGELRKQQIGFKDVTVQPGSAVVVVLRDESQRAKAVESIRVLDPSLQIGGREAQEAREAMIVLLARQDSAMFHAAQTSQQAVLLSAVLLALTIVAAGTMIVPMAWLYVRYKRGATIEVKV